MNFAADFVGSCRIDKTWAQVQRYERPPHYFLLSIVELACRQNTLGADLVVQRHTLSDSNISTSVRREDQKRVKSNRVEPRDGFVAVMMGVRGNASILSTKKFHLEQISSL